MKKKYIAPSIKIIEIEHISMLAASPDPDKNKGWTPSGDTKNDGFDFVEEDDKDHKYNDDDF